MSAKTGISWTQATWNPVTGCSKVSQGCKNCYAKRDWHRLAANPKTRYYGREFEDVQCHPELLALPMRWKKSRLIFVNSMSDLFHEAVPDSFIDQVFAVMDMCRQHRFQVLTKRPERMRDYVNDPATPFRVAKAATGFAATPIGPEEVRPINGFPDYFVSSHGHVYSDARGPRRKLRPDAGEQGHLRVPLFRDGGPHRGKRVLVHRLVLEAFVGPAPSDSAQGRHLDGNPSNNGVGNLDWGEQSSNWDDSKKHGSHRRYSKLTDAQAADIRERHATGETGEALAREFGVSATQIRNIASGRQWSVEPPIQWPLSNVWKGVSVENQETADERIPPLLQTPAAVRFISAEPLLGPIKFKIHHWPIDWLIAGGESGPDARPCHPDWARTLRGQCEAAGVPFHWKQWGNLLPACQAAEHQHRNPVQFPSPNTPGKMNTYYRIGKKAAGRLLDGREWNGLPGERQEGDGDG